MTHKIYHSETPSVYIRRSSRKSYSGWSRAHLAAFTKWVPFQTKLNGSSFITSFM